jgi:hypothetical protein
MTTITSMAIIAIVAVLALLGGVVMLVMVTIPAAQEVEAGCEKGFPRSAASFNASKGRCFGQGP